MFIAIALAAAAYFDLTVFSPVPERGSTQVGFLISLIVGIVISLSLYITHQLEGTQTDLLKSTRLNGYLVSYLAVLTIASKAYQFKREAEAIL